MTDCSGEKEGCNDSCNSDDKKNDLKVGNTEHKNEKVGNTEEEGFSTENIIGTALGSALGGLILGILGIVLKIKLVCLHLSQLFVYISMNEFSLDVSPSLKMMMWKVDF